MTELDRKIAFGEECPYCGAKPVLVDSSIIYGRSHGNIYLCKRCDAYVGVHQNSSNKPLGRLANKELREAKKKAHFYFDQLWKKAVKQGRSKLEARNSAYDWLCIELRIPRELTHIGMFNVEQCEKVIELSYPYCENKIYS
jgi:hypothetical protein